MIGHWLVKASMGPRHRHSTESGREVGVKSAPPFVTDDQNLSDFP
jgi:hypothetical protein